MDPVLVADGLCRGFGDGETRVEAVRSASIQVAEAELVVVLGRSGAGKSTLLSLCGGLDEPDEGHVTVAGRDVRTLHGAERDTFLRRTVGWVFQAAGLLPLLSAEENVALAVRLPRQFPRSLPRVDPTRPWRSWTARFRPRPRTVNSVLPVISATSAVV